MIEHEVLRDRVVDTARRQNAIAHGENRHIDSWRVGLVVGVHDVADDRGVSLRVAQLVTARVRYDASTVIAER